MSVGSEAGPTRTKLKKVTLTFASWNQLDVWLRALGETCHADPRVRPTGRVPDASPSSDRAASSDPMDRLLAQRLAPFSRELTLDFEELPTLPAA